MSLESKWGETMASVKVHIAPNMLEWILQQTQNAKLSDKVAGYLQSWAHGEKDPTFSQLEQVSKNTGIPLGYFFLKEPPKEDLSIIEYRTVDSIELEQPSRNLIDTLYDMKQVQNWMRDMMLADDDTPLNFVGSLKNERSVKEFAVKVRDILEIEQNWYENIRNAEASFKYLREKISAAGVIVMMNGVVRNNTHRVLSIDEFRAFTLIDAYAPLIFINSCDSANGRVFSLLHEFAHICVGEPSLFNAQESASHLVSEKETICNAVAAELLVPQEVFCERWESRISDDWMRIVEDLAKTFKCSTTVIARRAYDNDFIDLEQYRHVAEKARYFSKKKNSGGGNFYNTAGAKIDHHFLEALADSVKVGKTAPTEAFQLTNTNYATFTNLVDKVLEG